MRTLMIAIWLVALPCAAAAQDGEIAGTVSDDTGGVLPGVTVEASSDALPTGPRVTVTDTGRPLRPHGVGRRQLCRHVQPARLRAGAARRGADVRSPRDARCRPARWRPLRGGDRLRDRHRHRGARHQHASTRSPWSAREVLQQQGATQLVDLFRSLNVSHGVVGERNSWYNSNQPATLTENVANVNLRGLGASRTLVLINGRRHVPVPARLIGGRFVDVNTIPAIAIGRLEVLKEGAAATYGSDAVGGVANFVTRNDFRGFEFNVTHDWFSGAGGYDSLRHLGRSDRIVEGRARGRAGRSPGAADGRTARGRWAA